jgi:hypothetical protein
MDSWAHGDGYDPYIGRWSRPIARTFIDWLDAARGARWLDFGCDSIHLTARNWAVSGVAS